MKNFVWAITVIGIFTATVFATQAEPSTTQPCAPTTTQPAPPAGVKCWQEIMDVKPLIACKDDPLGYLLEMGLRENAIFWTRIAGPANREALTYFVRQFGQHDREKDLRWMLAAPEILLPSKFTGLPRIYYVVRYNPEKYKKRIHALHLDTAKALVNLWLQNPKLVNPYYHMLIWSYDYFGTEDWHQFIFEQRYKLLENDFAGNDSPEHFWLQCREFILMAHATGRDDLWSGSKPEDLPEQCAKWIRWMKLQYHFLSPHPEKPTWYRPPNKHARFWMKKLSPLKIMDNPFPDYHGPDIPARSLIFDLLRENSFWLPSIGPLIYGKPPAEWLADWINESCQISPATQPSKVAKESKKITK